MTRKFFQLLFVGITFTVIGAGIGFLQGYMSFLNQPMEIRLQFSGWAALTGCFFSWPVGVLTYYISESRNANVEWWTKLVALTAVAGIVLAVVLGIFFDAGWITALTSPVFCVFLASMLKGNCKPVKLHD
jgi:hypothetical protein